MRPTIPATLLAGLVSAASPAGAEDAAGRLILPGVGVGPIVAGITEADLAGSVPEGQVRRTVSYAGDGMYECGTEVFAGTGDAVFVLWSNARQELESDEGADLEACEAHRDLAGPVAVTIDAPETGRSGWRTPEGLHPGMRIADLAEIVGGPVELSVCPCGYGGAVFNREGLLPDGLWLLADFPSDADVMLKEFVDVANDYLLRSTDIPAGMTDLFTVRRIVVDIPER